VKRLVPILLTLLAVLLPGPAGAQSNGAVSGTVRGRFDAEVRALPFSVVEAWGPGFRRSVVTDSLGAYRIEGLPPGALRLRASYAGHTPVTVDVLVPREGDVLVDLELAARPVELPPVDVITDVRVPEPDPKEAVEESEALGRVDAAALEIGTGFADAGLADAVRAFGGNDPAQASDVLFMRGSTTDLKLVLLDGAPVYTPFHVAGLLKSFEPAVLGRADLHVGGAPARYDGGLTYILDLRTKRPGRDSIHVSGSLDLISGSLSLDGPLGDRAGVVASARSLHGLGERPLGASPYGYQDVLVSLEGEPSRNHLLRATGFWNREAVVLDLPGAPGVTSAAAPDEAWWSNRALSSAYHGRVGELLLETTVAASGYRATLPLQPSADPDEPTPAPILARAQTDRIRGGAEVARPNPTGTLRAGVSFETLEATYSAASLGAGTVPMDSHGTSTTVGAYVDATRRVGSSLVVRLGLRGDRFSDAGSVRLAPRAALTWVVAPEAMVTVATGRYHQLARATDVALERSLSEVVADTALASDLLPVASADHVVVSLDQTFGRDVRLGLAGFWKAYSGLRSTQTEPIRSSGIDLRVQRRGAHATAWLGYGLSWYWSGADLSGSSSDFTGRQLLTAGLFGSLGSSFGADVRVAFGAGLPYTSVPFGRTESDLALGPAEGVLEQTPPLPGGLDEDFLRVDVELYAILRPQWGGRTWQIRPYLRVLNALDRRDALFYAFEPWRSDELTPLAERPLVPVVGVAWRF
jgi:hypothetical protein